MQLANFYCSKESLSVVSAGLRVAMMGGKTDLFVKNRVFLS